ncbi:hypothetical protein [Candidatus Marimicrobium litorale]|uniref:Uncharacterized protein n=1 Tax=Candidatus Marimicrobium litorale TaxID=2518991 RepID=A0ABT3T987_9GAMM|nr:hypothetical protein [Candidatus Marimicrobium litorale]MCX2978849.1 hypothetical protein [Candidatus Marimicrobium litorale]
MQRAGIIGLLLYALLTAGCSDSTGTSVESRESIRDLRYCEIAFFYLSLDGITSETFNSFRINDCPQQDWESIDFSAVAQELGAVFVRPNGPRRWVMDAAQLEGSEQAERRFFGNLEFRVVANIQLGPSTPTPGEHFVEAKVKRDSFLLFYEDAPSYELVAPLGKRYVMQSYAQYVDPELSMAALDSLGPRISLPVGWQYRARALAEDLEVEDFQGLATVLRDPLENTYQRAEILEYLTENQVVVGLYNNSTMEYWTAQMSKQEARLLEVNPPWRISDHIAVADKSVYAQSPDAELNGRFEEMTLGNSVFYHSATNLCAPELHSSGLINTNQSRRFQELTFRTGRTVPYIVNHLEERFVLVSHAPGGEDFHNNLPPGWRHGEVQLSDDWRVVFENVIKTVEIVDGSQYYQGPVLLPGEITPPTPAQIFTHKMIMPTGENPFSQRAYECPHCTFEQLASINSPMGWVKGPTQIIFAEGGELRSTPCAIPSTVDFLPEVPGNEYQIIARPQSGRLVEFTPQGLIAITNVERDTELRFPAGRRIHELTSPDGDVYVMFAYGVDSMDVDISDFSHADLLNDYPRPTNWSYSTRILERELVLDSTGVASVLVFRGSIPFSTWEKR